MIEYRSNLLQAPATLSMVHPTVVKCYGAGPLTCQHEGCFDLDPKVLGFRAGVPSQASSRNVHRWNCGQGMEYRTILAPAPIWAKDSVACVEDDLIRQAHTQKAQLIANSLKGRVNEPPQRLVQDWQAGYVEARLRYP